MTIVSRLVFPLLYQPAVAEASGGTVGTSDATYTAFFTPSSAGKLVWGVGPAVLIPTASDINYNLSAGWYLTSAPIITANWKAEDGDKWMVPLGGGFGRVFPLGRQPVNFNTQLFYNAVRPDTLPSANIEWRFQLSLLFPK